MCIKICNIPSYGLLSVVLNHFLNVRCFLYDTLFCESRSNSSSKSVKAFDEFYVEHVKLCAKRLCTLESLHPVMSSCFQFLTNIQSLLAAEI